MLSFLTLVQVFRVNGVEPFRPEGEKFDPNQHEALFQLPDPSKEPGTVGVVTKVLLQHVPTCKFSHACVPTL